MADDRILNADVLQHIRADLAGVSALCRPVDVLGTELDVAALEVLRGAAEVDERRADDDVALRLGHEGLERVDQSLGFIAVLVHFPVAGDHELPFGAVHQSGNAGEGLALEEFEARAAAGGDMAHLVAEAELIDRGSGIAAADDRSAFALRAGARNGFGALCESVHLENAHRAVPDDGLRFADRVAVDLRGLLADVEALIAIGHRVEGNGHVLGIRCEFLADNAVDGEKHFDALRLCFLEQFLCKIKALRIEQGIADVVAHRLEEGVAHCAADEEGIAFIEQVFDNADLVADLFAAEDGDEGTLGLGQRAAHDAQFLLDQEAADGGQIMRNALGGGVSAVDCSERIGNIEFSIIRERFCELGIVLFFFLMETKVFEKKDLAALELGGLCLRILADNVFCEDDIGPGHKLRKALRNGSKAHFGNELALRAAEMGAEDGLRAVLDKIANGRKSADDAAFIGNIEVFIEGNVEIYANKDALAPNGDVCNGQFGHLIQPPKLLFDFCDLFDSKALTTFIITPKRRIGNREKGSFDRISKYNREKSGDLR